MSSLRRSARLAAKATSKSAPQQELSTKDAVVNETWTPNPVQFQARRDSVAAQNISHNTNQFADSNIQSSKLISDPFWNLKYTRVSDQANLKDHDTLMNAIFWHENRCENEAWEELENVNSVGWEYELTCAVRWLCIDSRILKESVVMRDKAHRCANRVNDLLYELDKKRDSLNEQLWKAEGCEFDKLHQESLKMALLFVTAHHVFDKYNQVMNEVVRESHNTAMNKVVNEIRSLNDRCHDEPICHVTNIQHERPHNEEIVDTNLSIYKGSNEPIKSEMSIDSEDDW